MKLLVSTVITTLLLSACASTTAPTAAPSQQPHYLLLGETHDNAEGHAKRLADLEARVAAGWRPAIAMEQFDREFQPQLSAAQASCANNAQCIIEAAQGSKRWEWKYYTPLITLAQKYQLPLLAANLSRADASKVVKEGYAAGLNADIITRYKLDQVPQTLLDGQIEAVRIGHCNQLPVNLLPGMARAQIARDVIMAEVMKNAGRDVVLIAGNGHVRLDLGAPQWLDKASLSSAGYIENAAEKNVYTTSVMITAPQRGDVCKM